MAAGGCGGDGCAQRPRPTVRVVPGPVFVSSRLGGPGAWATVVAAFGLGSTVGDLVLLRVRPRRALRIAALGLVLGSLQAAVHGAGAALVLTCLLQFLTVVGVTAFFMLWEVTLREHVPAHSIPLDSSCSTAPATWRG
jgi:hypothetical protein